MRIRAIDYLGNRGGGLRFTRELVKALSSRHPDVQLEWVSHGAALMRYRDSFTEMGLRIRLIDIPPENPLSLGVLGSEGFWYLLRRVGLGAFHFDVPDSAFENCDLVWFPWAQRHRVDASTCLRAVCTYHDAIIIDRSTYASEQEADDERETIHRWLESPARIVMGSSTAARQVAALTGATPDRFLIIPLSGEHSSGPNHEIAVKWDWVSQPYLLCPANTALHKNHETLLRGVASWGAQVPLVLTGPGTNLPRFRRRGAELRRLAVGCGLTIGRSLIPLGYTTEGEYRTLLDGAWALVMPSLAEGGGSFPVWEALMAGVPVVCSNIPVMQEMVNYLGGQVLWFDPHNHLDLGGRLEELQRRYSLYKTRAISQISRLRKRTWSEVADDYWRAFGGNATSLGGHDGQIPGCSS